MIICGDFAYPFDKPDLDFSQCSQLFLLNDKIINFECTLHSLNKNKLASGIAISSSDASLEFLKKINVSGVTLANNHIQDFEYDVDKLIAKFQNNNIAFTGLGENLKDSTTPIITGEFLILNFGWEVVGCKPSRLNSKGCNPLSYNNVISTFKEYFDKYKNLNVVIVFHWNYEFELYPQPSHRTLAKELIDLGAYAILGHHSHIIQGAELYNGRPIIYGLGNFYLPKFNYSGYYLDFPDRAYTGLAVDITNFDSYLVHSHENKLRVSEPIPLFENEEVMKVSQFAEMNDAEYLTFFKKNRVKRNLLPIYKSWGFQTFLNDKFVQLRQVFIDALVRLNLKKHKK